MWAGTLAPCMTYLRPPCCVGRLVLSSTKARTKKKCQHCKWCIFATAVGLRQAALLPLSAARSRLLSKFLLTRNLIYADCLGLPRNKIRLTQNKDNNKMSVVCCKSLGWVSAPNTFSPSGIKTKGSFDLT